MKMLRILPIVALVLVMAVSFGCSSRQEVASTPDESPEGMSAAEIAARELEEAKRTIVNETIYFTYDSFELSAESRAILSRKAEIMKTYPDLLVQIAGHCDERGTNEYNLALGERRARAASQYLVMLGVNPSQLEIISYGEERPADSGHNDAAWAKNRRDEFALVW
ncbi:MAG: peptidoglycan-associated lipoprotein Pal [Desulfovibrio sp.]|nr:MAG: peptidoglycan-associated lipoprotein Pal [Desulfovibrio sp.]